MQQGVDYCRCFVLCNKTDTPPPLHVTRLISPCGCSCVFVFVVFVLDVGSEVKTIDETLNNYQTY